MQEKLLREELEKSLNILCKNIGPIMIGSPSQFPYGWRNSAKGRTVWRIVEEIISQNLEKYKEDYGFSMLSPADSEVGVYDFKGMVEGIRTPFFVNIKSAVDGARVSKDDISKADKLLSFLDNNRDSCLFIATFIIKFNSNSTISIVKCIVMPINWIPDIYVNPSNNGNLQSSKGKSPDDWIERDSEEFISLLKEEIDIAREKRERKRRN